jgi:hypothetical protein
MSEKVYAATIALELYYSLNKICRLRLALYRFKQALGI